MHSRSGMVLWVAASLFRATQASAQDRWAQADQDTPRLTPAAFHQLPAKVEAALEAKRCTVPQSVMDSLPHNVIHGNFGRKGQTDWAVLCSRARASTIVIVWGGSSPCPDEMEVREDRSYLQVGIAGRIVFSRRIEPASRNYILTMHQRFGGEPPPELDHEGINDVVQGKGSTIRYCSGGKWLELTGDQTEGR